MSVLMKKSVFLLSLFSGLSVGSQENLSSEYTKPTVEELRITTAEQAINNLATELTPNVEAFNQLLSTSYDFQELNSLALHHGNALWKKAIITFEEQDLFDDRALYWARLKMTKSLRTSEAFKQLSPGQQSELLAQFELASRGNSDIQFNKKAKKRILVTGFDPFFLDRHIDQSNPSGAAALALDNFSITLNGELIDVETVVVPVRFADFDQGMIENILTPYLLPQSVDMVITISMGRDNFDLEQFPALRRSAKAPDNLNVFTGGTAENPVLPLLNGQALDTIEFLEFSLPALAMQKAKGKYEININPKVQTLTKTFMPKSLGELKGETSVQGSGGGYLSNEISYRSLRLRNLYAPNLPVGHIHTPRVQAFDSKKNQEIIEQIKAMITLAASEI